MIFDSAHDLVKKIKSKEISSVELLNAFLEQIEKVNPKINAVVALDQERAIEKAKLADNTMNKDGLLFGLPMTVKDAYEVEGIVSTGGNPAWKEHLPKKNAEAVQKLTDSGAIIFGKTNVPFLSADIQSFNDIYGVSNNPWDLTRTPGGSSGGSSAALASGMTPLELGSDIGGSIRIPAHFCGLFGHKPSLNIISEVGHMPPPPGAVLNGNGLSVAGPLARSPEDLELAMQVLVGPKNQDQLAWDIKLPKARTKKVEDIRIAVWPEEKYAEVDKDISNLINETAKDLKEAGAKVETPKLPFEFKDLDYVFGLLVNPLVLAGTPKNALKKLSEINDSLDDSDNSELAKKARGAVLKHIDWVRVDAMRHRIRQQWREFFTQYDVIICPTISVPAFKHNHAPVHQRKLNINGEDKEYLTVHLWSGPAIMAGLPSTNVPIGLSKDGLPIGMQVIGPYLEDMTCIEVAKIVRNLKGGFNRPPGF